MSLFIGNFASIPAPSQFVRPSLRTERPREVTEESARRSQSEPPKASISPPTLGGTGAGGLAFRTVRGIDRQQRSFDQGSEGSSRQDPAKAPQESVKPSETVPRALESHLRDPGAILASADRIFELTRQFVVRSGDDAKMVQKSIVKAYQAAPTTLEFSELASAVADDAGRLEAAKRDDSSDENGEDEPSINIGVLKSLHRYKRNREYHSRGPVAQVGLVA